MDERRLVAENLEILLDCLQTDKTIIGAIFAQHAPASRNQVTFVSQIAFAACHHCPLAWRFTARASSLAK